MNVCSYRRIERYYLAKATPSVHTKSMHIAYEKKEGEEVAFKPGDSSLRLRLELSQEYGHFLHELDNSPPTSGTSCR